MNSERPTLATALVTGLFFAGLTSGALTGAAALARAQDPFEGLELFASVLTIIETDYVDDVDQTHLIDAAIRGMVNELDPHTRWLSADQVRRLRDEADGKVNGLGITVERYEDGRLIVRDVLDGSSAARDGIAVGDRILVIDGVAVETLDEEALASSLEGERGDPVTLEVESAEGASRHVETVHDTVEHGYVTAEELAEGVVYVRIEQFPHGVSRDLVDAVASLELPSMSGMVLDVRDNPGGMLEEAIAVTDLFLDDGVIVTTRSRVDGDDTYEATPGGFPDDLRVAVLINGMSASASEIVAAALQERGRATLVGTSTYGKGSVQSLYRNPDDSALKLTIGAYMTPSGEPIAPRQGRAPDLRVQMSLETGPRATLRDALTEVTLSDDDRAHLASLVEALPEDPAVEVPIAWSASMEDRLSHDRQLTAALRAVRGPSPDTSP